MHFDLQGRQAARQDNNVVGCAINSVVASGTGELREQVAHYRDISWRIRKNSKDEARKMVIQRRRTSSGSLAAIVGPIAPLESTNQISSSDDNDSNGWEEKKVRNLKFQLDSLEF